MVMTKYYNNDYNMILDKLPLDLFSNDRHGDSNTMPKPESLLEYSHITKSFDEKRIFIDWLTFQGNCLRGMTQADFLQVVYYLIEGNLFRNADTSIQEDSFDYRVHKSYQQVIPRNAKMFQFCYENSVGVKVFVCYHSDDYDDEQFSEIATIPMNARVDAIRIVFSGAPLSRLIPRNNQSLILDIISFLRTINGDIHLSRIDCALEVPSNWLDLRLVCNALEDECYTGASYSKIINSTKKDKDGSVIGRSLTGYIGSPNSRKKIRIYDTWQKHKYDAVRIEVQSHDRFARFLETHLLAIHKNESITDSEFNTVYFSDDLKITCLREFIENYILSTRTFNFVEVSEKDTHKAVRDMVALPFWQKFKNKCFVFTDYRYSFCPEPPTIQKNLKWLFRKVSSSLCLLNDALSRNGLNRIIDAMIEAKQQGYNCTSYNDKKSDRQEELLSQLLDLGQKAYFEMFDSVTKSSLRQAGLYDKPLPRPVSNKYTVLCCS